MPLHGLVDETKLREEPPGGLVRSNKTEYQYTSNAAPAFAERVREIWKVYHETAAKASGYCLTVDEFAVVKDRSAAW